MKNISEAIIVTNSKCNLNCTYCKSNSLERDMVSMDEISSLINELAKTKIKTIHYIGGEPLLRKNIIELMKYSQTIGFINVLHSNGSNLKLLSKALPFIDTYHTCLNGDLATHEISRGKGTYKSTLLCIDEAIGSEKQVIVDFIVNGDNCSSSQVMHVLKLAKKIGFKVNFQKVIAHRLVGVQDEYAISVQAEDRHIFELFNFIEMNYDPAIMINSLEYIKEHQNQHYVSVKKCANEIIVIGSDGSVNACYDCMGRSNNNGLTQGWGQAISNVMHYEPNCVKCPYSNHAESNILSQARGFQCL